VIYLRFDNCVAVNAMQQDRACVVSFFMAAIPPLLYLCSASHFRARIALCLFFDHRATRIFA